MIRAIADDTADITPPDPELTPTLIPSIIVEPAVVKYDCLLVIAAITEVSIVLNACSIT